MVDDPKKIIDKIYRVWKILYNSISEKIRSHLYFGLKSTNFYL